MPGAVLKPIELIQKQAPMPLGMHFYASLESVMQDESTLGFFSVIKRAWREMNLNGVLFLDGCPVLYLKEYARPFTEQERLYYHKLFWNQGVANILILADPEYVYIYSGLAKPEKDDWDEPATEKALVEKITLADYAQRLHTLLHSLATGRYYEIAENQQRFDPEQAVDARLLRNLRGLRDALIQGDEGLEISIAHALIGRVLFLCYLLDRDIFTITKPDNICTGTARFFELLEKQAGYKKIDFLYRIFSELKERFNGNMFDQDLGAERRFIKVSHLNKISLFLGGHDVASGQLSFWPYDFKMIPVETISAIYQDFLSVEDHGKQRKRGAFYTPRFLAEMVVDIAVRKDPETIDGSFLDPACGSGIFLVILFTRLANRWLMQNSRAHYTTKVKAFQQILARQIHGVDLEETACRIACFSLYLAYLDFFEPPDIQEHIKKTGRPLPKLLDYGKKEDRPKADIAVIYNADFLEDEIFAGKTFSCVIGNPPWEGRGSKQLAQKFIQKLPGVLVKDGIGCLLLPSKILQNQTDAFQAEWLTQVTLEKVLQLADYRRLLFQGAKTPAFIARFNNTPPQIKHHEISFNAPKFNRDGLRQGIVKVAPRTRTRVSLHEVLTATQSKTAQVIWKRRLWGTARDQKFLDFLQTIPPLSNLAGEPNEGKRWVKGQGFQPHFTEKAKNDKNYPNPKPIQLDLNTPLAHTDQSHQMLLFQEDCIPLGKKLQQIGGSLKYFRRAPSCRLFEAPMVLISRGHGNIAYSDFNVVFQHYFQSISGPKSDSELLKFLTVLLRSKFAQYFFFHTAANLGTERDYITLSELLRLPFPLPGSDLASSNAQPIIAHVANELEKLQKTLKNLLANLKKEKDTNSLFNETGKDIKKTWRQRKQMLVDQLQSKLEPLIFEYFGLTEQEVSLVEDTADVFIQSSTPTTIRSPKLKTLDPIEKSNVSPYAEKGLGAYANVLTNTLNKWAEDEKSIHRVHAEGGTDSDMGIAMVTVTLGQGEKPYRTKPLSYEMANVLNSYYNSISKKSGAVEYDRDIFFFNNDMLHIIRPNLLINWTRTAALNDANRIYGEISLAKMVPK